jgi:hypothetical protein
MAWLRLGYPLCSEGVREGFLPVCSLGVQPEDLGDC